MEMRSFYYRIIRGAIGKKFVVKHYKGGKIVVIRFPDMSGIVPTEKQKVRRDLFREAVVFAKWIIADEERKRVFRNTLPRKKRKKVYQAALQMYIKMRGNKHWLSKQLAVMAVVESGKCEMMKGNGIYKQVVQWRVMWQKKKEIVDRSEQVVENICLLELQT